MPRRSIIATCIYNTKNIKTITHISLPNYCHHLPNGKNLWKSKNLRKLGNSGCNARGAMGAMGAITFHNFYKKNAKLSDKGLSDSLRKKNIIYMKLMAPMAPMAPLSNWLMTKGKRLKAKGKGLIP